MARVEPLPRTQLQAFESAFQLLEQGMGFVPTSLYIMGRQPAMLEGFLQMALSIYGRPGDEMPIAPELMRLIAHVSSRVSGCRYCQAHTASEAHRLGASPEKVEAIWEFEQSPLFSEAERLALRLAAAAGSVPNAATDQHFSDLRQHYNDEQITHIMGVVGLFGFLNRWNDSLATDLEAEPLAFAQDHLVQSGWSGGKHIK